MVSSEVIERAISSAAPMEFQNGLWVSDQSTERIAGAVLPHYADHDHPATFPSIDELNLPDHYVPSETLEEFEAAVYEFYRIVRVPISTDIIQTIERNLRHEGQHAEASIAIGAVKSLYTFKIIRDETHGKLAWQASHFPTSLQTTRAGIAAIKAYPEDVSLGDSLWIDKLRYRSIAEVAGVAEQYGLPIPLSIQKGLGIVGK